MRFRVGRVAIAVGVALFLVWTEVPPARIAYSTYVHSPNTFRSEQERGVVVRERSEIPGLLNSFAITDPPRWVVDARLDGNEALIFFPNNSFSRVVPVHPNAFAIAMKPSEKGSGIGIALLRGGVGKTMLFKEEIPLSDQREDTLILVISALVYCGLAFWWCTAKGPRSEAGA